MPNRDLTPSYELIFEERPGYLYALLRAEEMTLNVALEYLERVAATASELDLNCILLERDVPKMMGEVDLYTASKHFVELTARKRVAVVNLHGPIHTNLGFATLVAANRGGNHKLFDNVREAEEWLLQ